MRLRLSNISVTTALHYTVHAKVRTRTRTRTRRHPLIWVRVAGAAASAEKPRRPSPQPLPPALPGESQGVPRPAERYNPSSVSWVGPEDVKLCDT